MRLVPEEREPAHRRREGLSDLLREFTRSGLRAARLELDPGDDPRGVACSLYILAKRHGLPVRVTCSAGEVWFLRRADATWCPATKSGKHGEPKHNGRCEHCSFDLAEKVAGPC